MDKAPPSRPNAGSRDVTGLLRAWSDGDETALELLVPLIEDELRRRARAYMARERKGHTLQATALVNEVFLRFPDARHLRWQDRAHFVAIAARLMRRILVDHARVRGFRKRGAGAQRITLDQDAMTTPELSIDVLEVDRALEAFAKVDHRKSQVVELRFFGGLSHEEIADVLHVSVDTIKRDWRLARLWLARALQGDAPQLGPGRPRQ
jgi:RNA polymerase sigma-70 factor, ECF subfamily